MRKRRGLFSVPVFSGSVILAGAFDAAEALGSLAVNERALPGSAELVLSVANQGGLRSLGESSWDGKPMDFMPGPPGFGVLAGGLRAGVERAPGGESSFRMELSVQGGASIRVLPLGRDSSVTMAGDWPSPSYQGRYLPVSQSLSEEGFSAAWRASHLSHGIPLWWRDGGEADEALHASFFGVDLLETLDRYALNERATKHAALFIVLPFLAMFMLETFLKRRVHPVQYLLAGMANLVFYLLLLSLSEHVSFNLAYLAAAAATTLMVTLHSRSAFGSPRGALALGPVMGCSYLFLFVTLRSEDWALLIGSVGTFVVLGLVMFFTRRVDWYGGAPALPEVPDGEEGR